MILIGLVNKYGIIWFVLSPMRAGELKHHILY